VPPREIEAGQAAPPEAHPDRGTPRGRSHQAVDPVRRQAPVRVQDMDAAAGDPHQPGVEGSRPEDGMALLVPGGAEGDRKAAGKAAGLVEDFEAPPIPAEQAPPPGAHPPLAPSIRMRELPDIVHLLVRKAGNLPEGLPGIPVQLQEARKGGRQEPRTAPGPRDGGEAPDPDRGQTILGPHGGPGAPPEADDPRRSAHEEGIGRPRFRHQMECVDPVAGKASGLVEMGPVPLAEAPEPAGLRGEPEGAVRRFHHGAHKVGGALRGQIEGHPRAAAVPGHPVLGRSPHPARAVFH